MSKIRTFFRGNGRKEGVRKSITTVTDERTGYDGKVGKGHIFCAQHVTGTANCL